MASREQRVVSCRLYVVLARKSPVGVVFRRGPSEWVQILRWDTENDTFESGHWFHGRIYERRSDLTPDGTKMVYFATKFGAYQRPDSEPLYSWTAVSKPPYLTALALWPQDSTWDGGGLFSDNSTLHVRHTNGDVTAYEGITLPEQLNVIPFDRNLGCGEDNPLMDERMKRDDWQVVQEADGWERTERGWLCGQPQILRKWRHNGAFCLYYRHLGHYSSGSSPLGGWYRVEYSLLVTETQTEHPLVGAVWADWDQQGRVVFARDGKLFARSLRPNDDGAYPETELADFNPNKPYLRKAPDWATHW